MTWYIEYSPEAEKDLLRLDKSSKDHVLKAIEKVSQNPLPQTEGGLGKPLGNHGYNLTNCLKIKLRKDGIRVVYQLIRTAETMYIIIVSIREDGYVYKEAFRRIKK